MSVPHPNVRFTYDDYRTLPEDSGRRYELLHGELLMAPAPTPRHQRVSANLEFLLQQFVRQQNLGIVLHAPLDVVFGRGEAREVTQPDIIFISSAQQAIVGRREIAGAPDLIVEILSPATAERDCGYKKTLYARYGVREYWIVDPETRQIEVYRLAETGFVREARFDDRGSLHTPLLPGLQIPLAEAFHSGRQ